MSTHSRLVDDRAARHDGELEMSEMARLREKLSELGHSKDLRECFRGFHQVIDELRRTRDDLQVEDVVYRDTLAQLKSSLHDINGSLARIRSAIVGECVNLQSTSEHTVAELSKKWPEVARRIDSISLATTKVSQLKFVRRFTGLRNDIRTHLRSRDYERLATKYLELAELVEGEGELKRGDEVRSECAIRLDSLNEYTMTELKSGLVELLNRLKFPFEEAVDYKAIGVKLKKSIDAFKALHIIHSKLGATGDGLPALQVVLGEFSKRFYYHFYGVKPTNSPSKPEWFYTQLSLWISNNLDYFEQYIQPCLQEVGVSQDVSAKDLFIEHLVKLASKKVKSLVFEEGFVQDRRLLSHLIDETVLFEKEIQEVYDYPEEGSVHVISELCDERVLENWIKLERDTISIGIDSILTDTSTYESRYKGAADIDPFLVPNFADSFVILMQSMFERYRSVPNAHIQCRFLKLQLVIVDEFRSRIVQIFHQIDTPWRTPYPQLMNALWYLTLVLDDWSDTPEYIRLQYYVDNAGETLVRGTFDESSSLYRHVWRQRAKNLTDSFHAHLSRKLSAYVSEEWHAHDVVKPVDISQSFAPFLAELSRLLRYINENISPDSVLTIYHLTNNEVWELLLAELIDKGQFNHRGANQILFDVTASLIPLLTSLYKRPRAFVETKSSGEVEFDVVLNNKCITVLNSLKLLSLHPATAILLQDELGYVHEHQLDERLEPFHISGLSKQRVVELLRQRCDLKM